MAERAVERTRRGGIPGAGSDRPSAGEPGPLRQIWRRLRGIHPALVLAFLDTVGLGLASYLSYEELTGGEVQCGGLLDNGCNAVQHSQYAWIGPVPVAVFGVCLSVTLLTLALAWWRTGIYKLLIAHYALSLVGVIFEGWFQFAQFFLIKKFCVYCEAYGISLILRFLIALWVYLRTPNPDAVTTE